jgi:hypothetical protein
VLPGKKRLLHAPPLELSKVVDRTPAVIGISSRLAGTTAPIRMAVKPSGGSTRAPKQRTADDTLAHLGIEHAEDRSVGNTVKARERMVRPVYLPRYRRTRRKNSRLRRKSRHLRLQFLGERP